MSKKVAQSPVRRKNTGTGSGAKNAVVTGSNVQYSGASGFSSGGSGSSGTHKQKLDFSKYKTGGNVLSGYSGGSGAVRPASGGSGSGSTAGGRLTYSGGKDLNNDARYFAQEGDWSAVEKTLNARQTKIDAQGGNDRGTSNAQILAQLRQQYGDTYNSLAQGAKDRVSLAAGEKLPFTNYANQNGNIYKDKGWAEHTDYLAMASDYARDGDLDAAYDALMRRGFKMAETGSTGGGTSQDQAYALIHQLYSQSPGAQQTYENNLAKNARNLQEHQTIFGLETRPELAYKQFKSADGRYWIIYDGQGRPAAAKPVSARLGTGKTAYSQDEIDLMSRYYSGSGDRAELERQMHNLAVARTGNGRLVDAQGNWASGQGQVPISARDWNGLPENNRNQDTAALQALLAQINAGQASGTPVIVPSGQNRGGNTGLLQGGGGYGNLTGGGYGDAGIDSGDLSGYLQEIYRQNLEAQLAAIRSAYEQNAADFRAHDDLISQTYAERRNQAAGQNELQRMYMAEMGMGQGLNTGAAGQLALAQNAAYQGALAELWSAESQDRAANDLEMRKLAAAYQGDLASAQAQSNAQLAGALYNEYARQIQAAEARRQAELEAQRWQQQFDYQREQDALAQRNWQAQWDYSRQADARNSAYKTAASLMEMGILPDSSTLAAAGISSGDAENYVNAVQAALKAQMAQAARKTASSGSSSSGGRSSGSQKPRLTYTQVLAALEDGQRSDALKKAYDYYREDAGAYDRYYGAAQSPRTSFYYDPDEGLFSWNGKTYNDASAFLRDLQLAGLNDREMEALKTKLRQAGMELED